MPGYWVHSNDDGRYDAFKRSEDDCSQRALALKRKYSSTCAEWMFGS